jgi:hypothetical protein
MGSDTISISSIVKNITTLIESGNSSSTSFSFDYRKFAVNFSTSVNEVDTTSVNGVVTKQITISLSLSLTIPNKTSYNNAYKLFDDINNYLNNSLGNFSNFSSNPTNNSLIISYTSKTLTYDDINNNSTNYTEIITDITTLIEKSIAFIKNTD